MLWRALIAWVIGGALWANAASAQRRVAGSLADLVTHDNWTRDVPGNVIHRLAQDRDGYVLLATDNGFGQFDGVRFRVHTSMGSDQPDSLADTYFNDAVVARDGAIWLASMHAGLVEFKGGKFRSYSSRLGLPDYETNTVFEDSHGVIWAGTKAGAARLVGNRFEVVPGSERRNVISLAEDIDGGMWIGTDLGLLRFVKGRMEAPAVAWLTSARVQRMLRARDGGIWVATGQGLTRLERGRDRRYADERRYGSRDGLRSTFVSSLSETADGVLWVGTLGGGAARLEADGHFLSFGAEEGLPDNNVNDVFVDREANVWIATVDGLTRLRAPTLENWRGAGYWTTGLFWSVRADADGTVWGGTGGDGIARISPDGSARLFGTADGLPSEAVLTSYRSRDGTLWVGTRRGLARLAGDRFVDETERFGLPRSGVRTITEDTNGQLLVGTDLGLMAKHGATYAAVPHGPGLIAGRIYQTIADARGRLWVAAGPLGQRRGDSLFIFRSARGDTISQSMEVLPDSDRVWLGDYGMGLLLVRGDSMFRFRPERTGLFKQVLSIVDDGRGDLWLTSDQGLQRVAKRDLLAYAADTTRRIPSRVYTKDDGLRSSDIAKSGNASGTRDRLGRLWFPTSAGLVVLHPAAVRVDPTAPRVFIERVVADEQPLAATSVVRLPRGARHVSIEFTTTLLASPARVRFWYRLEGVDSSWRATADGLERVATYENLPRGTFRFQVRAVSPDGIESRESAFIDLESTPPLTRSAWFWLVVFSLLGTAGTYAYRWRVNRLRSHAAFLQRLVNERTESLAARERLEHQLLHAQKLESVGRLAGGVAHDLNNLLTAILGHAELALTEPDVPEQLRGDLVEVRTVAIRAANLTKQLLAFARKTVVQPKLLRLGELVTNLETLINRLLPEQVRLVIETLEDDWLVRADPNQVEQVVMNLALNARDAMANGGTLAVRTRAMTTTEAFVENHPEIAPGDYVLLEVTDTGTGMSADVQAHLFEPFFTTKEQGKGTGLGLATTFGIVTQSGGHILVESKEGEGSTFRVYLPRATGDLAGASPAVPAAMPRGSERILLVEDERAVRDVTERTLRALGYVVTTAGDGVEALATLEAMHGGVSLVLTDIRMPRLGGLELADAVRERWPGLRVACMSGHSEALLGVGSARAATVLRKPFTASELAVCVRNALDTPPGT